MGEYRAAAVAGLAVLLVLHPVILPGTDWHMWLASAALYGIGAWAFGALFRHGYPHRSLGLCNVVTLGRFVLTCLLVTPLAFGVGTAWLVVLVAAVALALDGVDGWSARRARLTSEGGARFDMEVDAALSVVLATGALWQGRAGTAVLILGLTRYAFAAAALAWPWLARPLPPSLARKAVCVLQLATLILVHVPGMPRWAADAAVAVASFALLWSFGRDIRWLWQARG